MARLNHSLMMLLTLGLVLSAEARAQDRIVQTVDFKGWSGDSSTMAWVQDNQEPGSPLKRIYQVTSTVTTLPRKAVMKSVKIPIKEFPGYLEKNSFKLHPLQTATNEDLTQVYINLRDRPRLVVDLVTEDRMTLYFWYEDGDDRLLLHKAKLKEIYFTMTGEAFLSPNGRRVGLVLTLDADVRQDAVVLALVLPPNGWQQGIPPELRTLTPQERRNPESSRSHNATP